MSGSQPRQIKSEPLGTGTSCQHLSELSPGDADVQSRPKRHDKGVDLGARLRKSSGEGLISLPRFCRHYKENGLKRKKFLEIKTRLRAVVGTLNRSCLVTNAESVSAAG